ncbi:MAG: hypothetical protein NC078_09155 [Ruminococcus sp.]|nr:hypothetical protein [Ruminococcus sp.]
MSEKKAAERAAAPETTAMPDILRKKKKPALLSAGLALLWVILLNIFPLDFYSLFLMSNMGSNVFLIALAAAVTFQANLLFSKLTKSDINVYAHLCVNIIFMTALVYTYSIFRYDAVWLVILAALLHCAVTVLVFAKTKKTASQTPAKEKSGKGRLIIMGVVCSAVSDFLYLLLFTLALHALNG